MRMPVDRALDAMTTKRWSLLSTTAESTVADHSFAVAIIAMAIRNKMFNTSHFTEQEVCYYAVIHDIREVLTGDVPTPVKERMRASGLDPDSLYEEIPPEPRPVPMVEQVIKLADLISNYVFIREHGAGARALLAANEVHGRLRRAIDGAAPDLSVAAEWVLNYIAERRSETDAEERVRLEEDRQRLRSTASFGTTSTAHILG